MGQRRLGRARAGGLAACVLAACVLAGCTTVRSSLGTSDSSCYLTLPTASTAVHAHGRMVGVHHFTLAVLRQKVPHLYRQLETKDPGSQGVCVFAFEGKFTAHSVVHPLGRASGRLAVVVSTSPSNHLLGTVIFKHAPLRFGHTHFG